MSKFFKSAVAALAVVVMSGTADATVFYEGVFAPQEGIVNAVEQPLRQELCLNGYWDFQPVATPQDYRYGTGIAPELPMPKADAWETTQIRIPSPWNVNAMAYRNLEGPDHRNYPSYPKEWENAQMGWLKKTVEVPAEWAGEDILLYFEAIAGDAQIYVDGKKVGENFDLFLPSCFDITDYVTPGEKAEILVGVRSQKLFEDNSTIGRRVVPAGSMWGYLINGIWQDVYMMAVPKVRISDVYIKPLVSQSKLQIEVELTNNTAKKADITLGGDVLEWINRAGTEVNTAPVPCYELGEAALTIKPEKVSVPAGATVKHTIDVPVADELLFWTPEHPNLYALVLDVKNKKQTVDKKYERFGWREWTIDGDRHLLNGEPVVLHSDSWHFQGIPQMTRRYAWAWFKAIKDMNGNAVRPHAQVYPRFYMDMADEMGICVLAETANWASDGGPKFDSDMFWDKSKEHLSRMVKRDRNHPAIFGWSISNENKPVILYVHNRPDLMPLQEKAWEEWRDIVREYDQTRPWISSDGEDDGNGILPVTVGHYGDRNSMRRWKEIGKPWGMGETAMAYYGTPEQTAKFNGERSYESALGRMEAMANECYNLVREQREMDASFTTVFNMVWYGLQPLPFGKEDLTTAPTLEDGIFFTNYEEGRPGVQPERMGPYSSTLNPGYDASLPLYQPWPMFDALRAANAGDEAAYSPWAQIDKTQYDAPAPVPTAEQYADVYFVGADNSRVKGVFDEQGVTFSSRKKPAGKTLVIVDATAAPDAAAIARIRELKKAGADVWIWGLNPQSLEALSEVLPAEITLESLKRSSFIPVQRSWARGLNNSDLYYCEQQRADATRYTMSGEMVDEGMVLINACRTDWRAWNKRPEEIKTAGLLRSENECTAALPVFIKYPTAKGDFYVSTLSEFANSEKGFKTLSIILQNVGVPTQVVDVNPNDVFFVRDGQLQFPASAQKKMTSIAGGHQLTFYLYSPRPLDDLLIEPNVPKLTMIVKNKQVDLTINDQAYAPRDANRHEAKYIELPLKQGWNKLTITTGPDNGNFTGWLQCDNRPAFVDDLRGSYINPENK